MSATVLRRSRVLLSLQRALLGAVGPALRAVTVTYTDSSIRFEAYFDGEIGADDREAMSEVETEVMADFPPTHRITHDVTRLDAPASIPKDRTWVFHRKEPLL